jgi:outer membrane receptor protein involved in Fe transport
MVTHLGRAGLVVSVSILGLTAAWSQASAQTAPPQAMAATAPTAEVAAQASQEIAAESASQTSPGDIIVTATKRSTTVQNTPIAITALTDKSLQNIGATSIADIVRQVPGFNLIESDSGRTRISIRGIQTAGESTVGLYYGETPLTGPAGTSSDPSGATPNLNLFDVERVEVLRGPQGTLYGAGSMGGTLRVIFKEPNLTKYEGATEFQAESTKDGGFGYFAKGAVNVPLVSDMLAARLVLYRQQSAGYVDDIVLHTKNQNRAVLQGGRFLVEFKPSDRLQFNAMALLQTQDIDGSSQWKAADGPYISESRIAQPWHDKLQLYSLTSKWDIGFATLTLDNSYYKWNVVSTNDNSDNYASVAATNRYCPLFISTTTSTTTSTCNAAQTAQYQAYAAGIQPAGAYQPRFVQNYTNELRLSSNGSGPFTYTLGVFREDRNDRVDTLVFPAVAATGLPREPVQDLGSRYIVDSVQQTAEYGEISYKLWDNLTGTFGLRHYHYNKDVGGAYLGYNYFNGQVPRDFVSVSANADGFVKKFNLNYHITQNVMTYATAAQGFRPGGANNIPGLPISNSTYKPDSLWNYELGVKTQLFDHHATFNVAVYRIDWTDLQTSVQATYGNFSFIDNIGKARIEGVEAEASATPVRGFTLNGSFNYLNPRLTADQVSSEATAPGKKGDILPLIPRMTASAGAEYDWDAFAGLKGLLRVDYTYTGKMTTQLRPTNVNYRTLGMFSIVNARFGFQNDGFGIFLYANNVFNEVGLTTISSAAGTPDYDVSTRPRTIGINMRKSF